MESEQMVEWLEVRTRAVDHLRRGEHVDGSKFLSLAQLLIVSPFSDSISVDIVSSDDENFAYVTYWRFSKDIKAFVTPIERLKYPKAFVPTFESHQVDLPNNQLSALIDQISQANLEFLSLIPKAELKVLDGVVFELSSIHCHPGIRLRWHHRLPYEWLSLESIVDQLW